MQTSQPTDPFTSVSGNFVSLRRLQSDDDSPRSTLRAQTIKTESSGYRSSRRGSPGHSGQRRAKSEGTKSEGAGATTEPMDLSEIQPVTPQDQEQSSLSRLPIPRPPSPAKLERTDSIEAVPSEVQSQKKSQGILGVPSDPAASKPHARPMKHTLEPTAQEPEVIAKANTNPSNPFRDSLFSSEPMTPRRGPFACFSGLCNKVRGRPDPDMMRRFGLAKASLTPSERQRWVDDRAQAAQRREEERQRWHAAHARHARNLMVQEKLNYPSLALETEARLGRSEGALRRSQSVSPRFQRWLPQPFRPKQESPARSFYPEVQRVNRRPRTRLDRSQSTPGSGTPATTETGDNVKYLKMRRQFATMVRHDPRASRRQRVQEDMSPESQELIRARRALGHEYDFHMTTRSRLPSGYDRRGQASV